MTGPPTGTGASAPVPFRSALHPGAAPVRTLLASALLALAAGCGGPKTIENTTPLTAEEKAKVAAEDRAVESDESPNNKTRKDKKKGK